MSVVARASTSSRHDDRMRGVGERHGVWVPKYCW
jgi:hypothetical protein